jgi:predicted dehydrogenase
VENKEELLVRKIRMGMVGGGEGAFIGAVHRIAAAMDGQIELVSGCFSSNAERSRRSGAALLLDESRVYCDYAEMMAAEAALPEHMRIDFVAIVTPNHMHLPVAIEAFKNGFHVMSDKPATLDLKQAHELTTEAAASGKLYGLSHTYLGYPMVQEARARIANGELGTIRKIIVEYNQGWLATNGDDADSNPAGWRMDPSQSGASCCMGDIGTHAFNLAESVSGLAVTELCADIGPLVPGHLLDDDGTVMLRFENGARGVLIASQVSVGEENALTLRIYGEKAGLEWCQEEPNTLWLKYNDKPSERIRTGWAGSGNASNSMTRTPAGHPEGYLEAFANLYLHFAERILALEQHRDATDLAANMPGLSDARRGMGFVETVVAASASDKKWHTFRD